MFSQITKSIDDLLNSITMYRVMLYFLIFLWVFVLIISGLNLFPFSISEFLFSSSVILTTCYIANKIFSKIFNAPTNLESTYITALILIFIVLPAKSSEDLFFVAVVSILAMASKYILAVYKKHIFNPAAVAVLITSLFSIGYATWWIGNGWTLIPILIGGFLIIKKIKRFSMAGVFLVTFLATTLIFAQLNGGNLIKTIQAIIFDSPILFFASVMLIEPLTSPTRKRLQIIYGLLVGILAGSQFSIGPIYSTYETALIIGNIFAYIVSFKRRIILTLKDKKQIANGIYEFIFSPDYRLAYSSGQYLEWTLPHKRPDSRGVRRYFTIASSPTEESLHLGVKIDPNKSSSFKKTLLNLAPGQKITAGQLSGDFVLPKDKSKRLAFIAGGIGVTPMRSMIKKIIDKKENRDIVFFYSCSNPSEFVYEEIFDSAKKLGVKTVYICSHPSKDWKGVTGRIDEKLIKEEVTDYKDRTFYLSGPDSMVNSYKKLLRSLGVQPLRIVTDYFPGY